MPREDRRIIFSADEVYNALYALSKKKGEQTLSPGRIVQVEMDQEGKNAILHLEDPHTENKEILTYGQDFLAAALLLFCRGLGIPVPRGGKKSVMVMDNQIVLRIQI